MTPRWRVVALLLFLLSAMYRPAATPSAFELYPVPHVDAVAARLLQDTPGASQIIDAFAVDLDRDGDLDVVASTLGSPVLFFVNDGRGHLSARPVPPILPGAAPVDVLHRGTDAPAAVTSGDQRVSPALLPSQLVALFVGSRSLAGASAPAVLAHPPSRTPARAPPVLPS